MSQGAIEIERAGGLLRLKPQGRWTTAHLMPAVLAVKALGRPPAERILFDLSDLTALDTAGAMLLENCRRDFAAAGRPVESTGAAPAFARLIERVRQAGDAKPPALPRRRAGDFVAQIGAGTLAALAQARDLIEFLGAVALSFLSVLRHPRHIRWTALVSHIEQTGLNAMPIVGLITFLVGIVLAYQGVDQLRQFGAEVFAVNLVGVATLREMGILLTAIMVAGRSGSAFTAQIGTMQVNEEVDAIRTLGLQPIEVLVLPRIMALIVAVPLLTFFANLMSLLGGGMMLVLTVDLTPIQFINQLGNAITLNTFWVGIVKAPVFAFLIGLVGCFEGLRVQGSAESVGKLTTQSVVESIFLVIVFDALFSIMFSYLGI